MKENKLSIHTNLESTRKTLISTSVNESQRQDDDDVAAGERGLHLSSDSDGEEINLKVRETKAKHKSAYLKR